MLWSAVTVRAQTDAATAERLARSSGLWEQLGGIAPQVRAGFKDALEQSGIRPSASESERLAQLIDEAYAAERMRASALAAVKAHTLREHVPALQRWYDSSLGRRITQLEEAAATDPEDHAAQMQKGVELLASLTPERRAMFEELARVTRAAEAIAQLVISTTLAAQGGALSMMPNAPVDARQRLRAALEAQRPQMIEAYRGLALASFAKTYAGLPSEELQRYLGFLSSTAGQHFNEVGLKAMNLAFTDAARLLGRGLPGTSDKLNS
jgi:hypothetical protein